jgi:colanic acid biosynthesis glycosyl transferase WcaI
MMISIHTMYFLPDFGSAPILMNELAAGLAARGHEVEVVATIPRERGDRFRRTIHSLERKDGFAVHRFRTNANPKPFWRLMAWNTYTLWTMVHMLSFKRGQVFFLRTPPVQLGVMGWMAAKLKGVKVLLNVQDIHPDLSIESGILKHGFLINLALRFERWVYDRSDRIVVISEGFRDNLLAKGVDPAKLDVIPNWVDTGLLKPHPKDNPVARKYGLESKFVVMYSGTISISSNRALERVLEAAALLKDDPDILIVLVGEGTNKPDLEARARSLGLDNVRFLPFQPYKDLPLSLSAADVLLVPLDREKSHLSVPSKLYNFMAAGRPILGLAVEDSEVALVIRETECGVCAPPDDPKAIAGAVRRLKSSPSERKKYGENGRRHVVEHSAKDMILDQFERLMASL